MTKYEDVKDMPTNEYFNNNQFSIDAFNKKYTIKEGETYIEAVKRVCDYVASVEKTPELQKYWSERWFDEIFNDWFHPAGSIMQGAASGRKISMSNCTTLSFGLLDEDKEWDSLEAIFKNAGYTVAKCAAYRQGLGLDFSTLRPKGSEILNSANQSDGAIHWMRFVDSIGYLVGQKGRIPAMLFSLSISHPDIEDFIKVKSDRTKIQNANISVQISDAFYKCAEEDGEWETKFVIPKVKKGDKVYVDVHSIDMNCKKDEKGWYYIARASKKEEVIIKKFKAKKLLELIAKNMYENAEPGIQNIDIAKKYSNSDAVYNPDSIYDSRIISTNACCVVGDTKIITDKGNIPIKEIYERMKNGETFNALSCNTNSKWKKQTYNKILNCWQNRHDKTVKISFKEINHSTVHTNKFTLECSYDHPIYTKDGYVKAESISNTKAFFSNKKWRKPSHLEFMSEIKPLYDIEVENNHNFFTENGLLVKNSEQYLSRESLCVLASINMGKFSTDMEALKEELLKIGESINRFLDNVNECELFYETYATPHQKLAIEMLRRTGAGVTNIGGWLFKSNLEYGTQIANEKVEEFMDWYNYNLYKSSINLGKEKGNFGLFNKEKFSKSPFVKRLIKQHPDLSFDTMRNVTCSSIAPTGTLTLMFRDMLMSYGIEPAFGIYFWKRTRISGKYEYYFTVPRIVRDVFEKAGFPIPMKSDAIKDTWDGKHGKPVAEFIDANKDKIGIHFKDATQVSVFDKLDLMSRVMRWVDSSISVTYMLPEKTDWKDIYKFILEAHKKEVKSIAAFPDKKMYGIVSFIPFKDLALKLKLEDIDIHPQNFSEEELKELHLSLEFIKMTTAPRRPEKLDADIYSVKVKGENFVIAVGILNGSPYELFAGHMNGLNFKFQYKKGLIEKISRGKYRLEIGDDIAVDDFSKQFTPVEVGICRLISTSLRHGVPLKFIVEQLNKSTEDIASLTSAAARVLKKYIKDGEGVVGVSCPACNSTNTLIYRDGCVECSNCNWSKCS